jgi:predicted lipoprotein with Yx(FWY)xxD motif
MSRLPRISLLVLVAAIAVAVVASATTSSAATRPTLGLRTTSDGKVIVDRAGMTMYEFGHDRKNVSRCSGTCAMFWPPAKAPAHPTLAKGLSSKKLKVIRRSDGSRQLSYNGHPLYRYSGDTKPGQTNGEGITAFGGTWYVLSRTGAIVTGPPSSGTANTNPYPY